ncbi:putative pectinesterase/pectinesterase inhibitor 41 [Bienertia sinuspersici]
MHYVHHHHHHHNHNHNHNRIQNNASSPIPASSACQSTQYPSYCNNILHFDNTTASLYEYGRFSFKRAISQAQKFIRLINRFLNNPKRRLRLTPSAVGALQDCQFLAELNLDFLTSSFYSVREK